MSGIVEQAKVVFGDPVSTGREKVAEAICHEDSECALSWELICAHPDYHGELRDYYLGLADAAIAAHLEALKERYAVVERMAPTADRLGTVGDKPSGGPVWRRDTNPGGPGGVATVALLDSGEVVAHISCLRTPDDARWAAAALLAAAARAVVVDGPPGHRGLREWPNVRITEGGGDAAVSTSAGTGSGGRNSDEHG